MTSALHAASSLFGADFRRNTAIVKQVDRPFPGLLDRRLATNITIFLMLCF
jgi:hypothetical protein